MSDSIRSPQYGKKALLRRRRRTGTQEKPSRAHRRASLEVAAPGALPKCVESMDSYTEKLHATAARLKGMPIEKYMEWVNSQTPEQTLNALKALTEGDRPKKR